MNSTNEEDLRETLLRCYRELKQKGKLSKKMPSIGVIFGEFLAKAGHRRFFIHECESFVNIKRNAGHFIMTFSVFDESSRKNEEFIAVWRLLKDGRENYTIQKTLDLDDKSHKVRDHDFESEKNLWIHYESIFREFIAFFKKKNFMHPKSNPH